MSLQLAVFVLARLPFYANVDFCVKQKFLVRDSNAILTGRQNDFSHACLYCFSMRLGEKKSAFRLALDLAFHNLLQTEENFAGPI